jgi:hypothetical protein
VSKAFSRYIPALTRTFALRAFNAHETELNRHYWSFKVVAGFSAYTARAFKKTDPTHATAEVFHASGPDAARIPRTVSDWMLASKDLENWLRLSALVSASSYLEAYLRQAVQSALMSDPMLLRSNSRILDGLKVLKEGKNTLVFTDEIETLTGHLAHSK